MTERLTAEREAQIRDWASVVASNWGRDNYNELLAELDAVRAERDKAQSALRIVQAAAKVIVAGADRRVIDATAHEPAAREAIRTLDSERQMNEQLTVELARAEATLAAIRDSVMRGFMTSEAKRLRADIVALLDAAPKATP